MSVAGLTTPCIVSVEHTKCFTSYVALFPEAAM